MDERPPVGSIVRMGRGRARYEVVSHRCGGTNSPCFWPDRSVAAWMLDKDDKRVSGPYCLDAALLTVLQPATKESAS